MSAPSSQSIDLTTPLTLPNGSVLKNRIAKAAMSEVLGTSDNRATARLQVLYRSWAEGGSGLLITGNVMIDSGAIGEPNNVAIENGRDLEVLQGWASAGSLNGTQIWMQLNHPGKQAPIGLNRETVAPSAIPFGPSLSRYFATPRELGDQEIREIIAQFGRTAAIAEKAGFAGVQIHGAHGYLVSQFLSPRHNHRTDEWGGNPKNRRRFLLEVYQAIRTATSSKFGVGVKLNSADFQKGGFSEDESLGALRAVADLGIDLIEISGGTYESPAMTGTAKFIVKDSTQKREAYFLEFAKKARQELPVPLMLTGGFRTYEGMNSALASGAIDIVGLARPLAIEPGAPHLLLGGGQTEFRVKPIRTGLSWLDKISFLEIAWYENQLHRIAKGKSPNPSGSLWPILISKALSHGFDLLKARRM